MGQFSVNISSNQINKEKCKALGNQGYVMKPIVKREIAVTIQRALDRPEGT